MWRRAEEGYPDPWWGDQNLRVLPFGIALAAGGITLWARDRRIGMGVLFLAGGAAAAAWAAQHARSVARHHGPGPETDTKPGTATTNNGS
jgi:hypothetical protein